MPANAATTIGPDVNQFTAIAGELLQGCVGAAAGAVMPPETSVTATMEMNRHALRYALQTVLRSRQTIGLGLLALGGAVLVVGYGEALHHAGLKDEHLIIALAIFVAAMTSGIAGFAFSGICGAMLFHLMNGPVDIVRDDGVQHRQSDDGCLGGAPRPALAVVAAVPGGRAVRRSGGCIPAHPCQPDGL